MLVWRSAGQDHVTASRIAHSAVKEGLLAEPNKARNNGGALRWEPSQGRGLSKLARTDKESASSCRRQGTTAVIAERGCEATQLPWKRLHCCFAVQGDEEKGGAKTI